MEKIKERIHNILPGIANGAATTKKAPLNPAMLRRS
jgi:hypothetical protein